MQKVLFAIASRFWPELDTLNLQRKVMGTGEVITFLYSTPLALIGLIWLALTSDFGTAAREWPLLVFLALLMFLFRKLGFFFITEIRAGRYASSDGSMESMVLWIGLLVVGPVTLWLAVILSLADFLNNWPKIQTSYDRWNRLRSFSFYQASTVLASLIALSVYRRLGGEIPLPGLFPQAIWPAYAAILVHFGLVLLIWLGFILYAVWTQMVLVNKPAIMPLARFLVLALGLPVLAHPFAILGAGLYIQNGPQIFTLFIVGLVIVAILTRQLSWAAESNRQRSRQLENLEELGRRILNAPPDASMLPDLLRDCLPSMFPSGRYILWVDEVDLQVKYPEDWTVDIQPVWNWLNMQTGVMAFLPKDPLPWHTAPHNALVVAPILDVESNRAIGGIYLELHSLAQPWDIRSLATLFPAVLSLAAQVASALHQVFMYTQALAYQKVSQELSLAGKIQASFLPDELPRLNGWQLSVTLLPARETSGDFFDLIPISENRLGVLIADVADKGVGAALYMALSRTLIRTYAVEFDDDPQPEVVLFAANGRLLKDARADLFVTAFYGILNLETGELIYANAGHNPPYLLRSRNEGEEAVVEALLPTGMPIGIEEESVWDRETAQMLPGDVLVMYTDGIPDSQNDQGEFFREDLLLETVIDSLGHQANEIQDRILERVQKFVGDAPQFDDITLMILRREEMVVGNAQEGNEESAQGGDTRPPLPISESMIESEE